jgi:outer membrane protein TolC
MICGLTGLFSLALVGCQPPMPPIDTAGGIARATLIDSAIEWRTAAQPIDAPAATGADDSSLSLAQATQLALRNSPELQSALWKVRLAEADARQERLFPNPVLAFTIRFVEGGGKPAIEASIAEDLLALLRRGGKIAIADQHLRAASADALKEAADLIAEAHEAYIAAAIVDEELEILAARRQLLDRLLKTAQTRLDAGEGTRLDVTTLQAQRIELDGDIADKEAERTDQRIGLARIIGRPSGRIDWALDRSLLPTAVAGSEQDWIATALLHRPELESRRWELAALASEAELVAVRSRGDCPDEPARSGLAARPVDLRAAADLRQWQRQARQGPGRPDRRRTSACIHAAPGGRRSAQSLCRPDQRPRRRQPHP